jgi:hypothetical protein
MTSTREIPGRGSINKTFKPFKAFKGFKSAALEVAGGGGYDPSEEGDF